jgi:hypothetical protein
MLAAGAANFPRPCEERARGERSPGAAKLPSPTEWERGPA